MGRTVDIGLLWTWPHHTLTYLTGRPSLPYPSHSPPLPHRPHPSHTGSRFQNIDNVINAFVVETEGKITDMVSFYSLPSSILGHPQHTELRAAYLYYTVATVTPLKCVRCAAHNPSAMSGQIPCCSKSMWHTCCPRP